MSGYENKGLSNEDSLPPPYPGTQQEQRGYPPQQQGYNPPQYGYPQQQQTFSTNVVTVQPGMYPSTPISYNGVDAPKDYYMSAIVATICCFWPTGIFAIMKATEVRTALARGDLTAARTAAASARQLFLFTVCLGVFMWVLVAICVGVYIGIMTQRY